VGTATFILQLHLLPYQKKQNIDAFPGAFATEITATAAGGLPHLFYSYIDSFNVPKKVK
jgi:hypothetical protein